MSEPKRYRYELLLPFAVTEYTRENANEAFCKVFGGDVNVDWRDEQTVWITTRIEIHPTATQPDTLAAACELELQTKCHQLGRDSFAVGITDEQNPYPDYTIQGQAWSNGWHEADDE